MFLLTRERATSEDDIAVVDGEGEDGGKRTGGLVRTLAVTHNHEPVTLVTGGGSHKVGLAGNPRVLIGWHSASTPQARYRPGKSTNGSKL